VRRALCPTTPCGARSGCGLFVEAQRFLSSAYPAATWPHPAAAAVDRERRGAFEQAGAHYESSYYLTFTWGLPPDHSGRAADFFYEDGGASGPEGQGDERRSLERDLYHFEKTVAEVTDILRSVLPEVGLLDDDQTLTYLHSTVSTHRHPVRRPETPAYLDAFLPDMPFTPGDVPMLGDHFLHPHGRLSGIDPARPARRPNHLNAGTAG
jgi:type IV secretion system protein VirB4